jgi:tetratricopeptide (TPR) repeat protein
MKNSGLAFAVIVLAAVLINIVAAVAGERPAVAGERSAIVVKPSVHAQTNYTKAAQALRSGDYAGARSLLERIVSEEPEVSQYHYALSMAYSGLGDFQNTWQQLRQTLQLNPQHKEAERDIVMFWQLLEENGLFNIGVAGRRVQELLGEPDYIKSPADGSAGWQGWHYAFWLIEMVDNRVQRVLDVRGIDPKLLLLVDNVKFSTDDRDWVAIRRSGNRDCLKTEYLPPGQSMQHWTELFSTQHFLAAADRLSALLEIQHRQLAETDPHGDWRIIEQRPGDVLYEWYGNTSGQYLITRLITGVRDVHQLSYAVKTAQPAAATRQLWIGRLKQVRLSEPQPDIFHPDSITYLSDIPLNSPL